jgi:hypothetical protein
MRQAESISAIASKFAHSDRVEINARYGGYLTAKWGLNVDIDISEYW